MVMTFNIGILLSEAIIYHMYIDKGKEKRMTGSKGGVREYIKRGTGEDRVIIEFIDAAQLSYMKTNLQME